MLLVKCWHEMYFHLNMIQSALVKSGRKNIYNKVSLSFLAVVPVAAATMTPIPLLLGLCIKKITERFCLPKSELSSEGDKVACGIIKGMKVCEKRDNNTLDELEYQDEFKESESTQKLMLTVESPNDEQTPTRR